MPHPHPNKPALCAALAGGFMSCTALIFAATPANAQPLPPTAGPEDSAVGLTELAPSISGDAGSISPSASTPRMPDASIFAEGSNHRFVLDNPVAQAVQLPAAIASPAARSFQESAAGAVEYTLLGDALQDSGPLTGFAGTGARSRDDSDWRSAIDTVFANANIQSPSGEQDASTHSYGLHENAVVYGENTNELSPLYYRPLTERFNLTVRSYGGYEDASPGKSDPIAYTGIGLTISREAWPK